MALKMLTIPRINEIGTQLLSTYFIFVEYNEAYYNYYIQWRVTGSVIVHGVAAEGSPVKNIIEPDR